MGIPTAPHVMRWVPPYTIDIACTSHIALLAIPAASGVLCGAAASGQFTWTPENVAKSIVCMIMSGPLLTGYTQTINDYYDRELDAINEPYRPIPSGDTYA